MENDLTSLDAAFQALANPTRRGVVRRLMRGPASVKELAAPVEMGLPSFLKHLKVLEDSGLIRSSKKGRVRTCRVNIDKVDLVGKWVQEQLALWESRYENLDRLLAELEEGEDEA